MAVPGDAPTLPPGEIERAKTRESVEKRLFTLAQDLYELEICAGSVVKDKEHMIPDLLYVHSLSQNLLRNSYVIFTMFSFILRFICSGPSVFYALGIKSGVIEKAQCDFPRLQSPT